MNWSEWFVIHYHPTQLRIKAKGVNSVFGGTGSRSNLIKYKESEVEIDKIDNIRVIRFSENYVNKNTEAMAYYVTLDEWKDYLHRQKIGEDQTSLEDFVSTPTLKFEDIDIKMLRVEFDEGVEFELIRANCQRFTFQDKKVLLLVQSLIEGNKILNLYAGETVVDPREIRVDSNAKRSDLTYCMQDDQFLKLAKREGWLYDTTFWDPDWNKRKSKEMFEGHMRGRYTRYKGEIVDIVKPNGIIISAGYQIDNFGKSRGMKLEKLFIINPSGEQSPFFITVERKVVP